MKCLIWDSYNCEWVKGTAYNRGKELARREAIEWQARCYDDWDAVCDYEQQAHFERLAKRYGLIREFRENAII